ncbi:hypothetical protein QCA50_020108 [Cerrena zonata]|uniref:[Histone H3]-trimethyl-L-lysine(9) demethylase n=1 Tax=Cerrena zonata TaxID=2478898 RepID=A0AAW0F9J9_9APHY
MDSLYKENSALVVEPAYYSGGIPVFTPTMKQFEDFYQFNKAINKYGMQSGIVKIVPPKEWADSLADNYTEDNLLSVKVKNPIIQHMNCSGPGVYSQQNVERARSYSIFQWKELSEKPNHQPPAPKGKVRGSVASKAGTTKGAAKKDNQILVEANEDTDAKDISVKDGPSDSSEVQERSRSNWNIDSTQFDQERCEQLERIYWKSLTYAEPMYGADVMGSLFSDDIKSWNVAHLPNILDLMDVRLPGVNDAYLYAGLWKATFSWHLEDQDLYSINYIHFGAPKQWYSIPQEESGKFFDVMKDTFNDEYKSCPEFLRHKTFLVSPQFLEKHGVQCNKIVHNEGEFIITYPYGYHAGFNYGYNLAESVNFALDDWFPFGEKTSKCECISDSVGINVKQLFCSYKGIPYVYDPTPGLTSDLGEETEDEEIMSIEKKPVTTRAGVLFNNDFENGKPVGYCKYHRNKISKLNSGLDENIGKLCNIPTNSLVQFTFGKPQHVGAIQGKDFHCGLVISNNVDENTLDILIYPDLNDRLEVQYKDLILGSNTQPDNDHLFNIMGNQIASTKRHSDTSIDYLTQNSPETRKESTICEVPPPSFVPSNINYTPSNSNQQYKLPDQNRKNNDTLMNDDPPMEPNKYLTVDYS